MEQKHYRQPVMGQKEHHQQENIYGNFSEHLGRHLQLASM